MKNAVKHISCRVVWIAIILFFTGCAGGLYTGGYDTYLDANGDLVRAYPTPFFLTLQTGLDVLTTIGGKSVNRIASEHETLIQARAVEGSPMQIRFIREGRNITVVRVRTGRLGHFNQEYSQQFHVYLAQRLERHSKLAARSSESARSGSTSTKTSAARARASSPARPARTDTPESSVSRLVEEDTPGTEPAVPIPPKKSGDHTADPPGSGAPAIERDKLAEFAKQTDPVQPKPDFIILFEKDSNTPSTAAMSILEQAARRIQANPDAIIEISGYADNDEDPDSQLLVSENRAITVKFYLIGKGIEPRRIRAAWHGSKYSYLSPKDKRQQRRVEIRLIRGL